jgi:ribonuclease HI
MHVFFSQMGQALLRNKRGQALVGQGCAMNHPSDANTVEAYALLKGLQLINRIGCSPIILESDSLELVQAFNGDAEIWSLYTAILADCFQLANRLGHITVQHCFREGNKVAHNFARYCFDSNISVFWDNDPPSVITSDVILNDVILFTEK